MLLTKEDHVIREAVYATWLDTSRLANWKAEKNAQDYLEALMAYAPSTIANAIQQQIKEQLAYDERQAP